MPSCASALGEMLLRYSGREFSSEDEAMAITKRVRIMTWARSDNSKRAAWCVCYNVFRVDIAGEFGATGFCG
jgi:hypothetical protein